MQPGIHVTVNCLIRYPIMRARLILNVGDILEIMREDRGRRGVEVHGEVARGSCVL
jgi:hypothetical protein